MPCNSDYMEANGYEVEISRVACLLNELNGESWKRSWWDGYHPAVDGKVNRAVGDALVRTLCEKLTACGGADRFSLEMQMWWRDHQAADREREAAEAWAAAQAAIREAALSKLTPEERGALGLGA